MRTTFTTHNDGDIDITGTCRRGYAATTYARLVEVFGEPRECGCSHKTDWEWAVEFMHDEEPVISTIYNWKNGPNYCGPEGLHCTDIKEWNVGGNSGMSFALVYKALAGGEE